MRDRIVMEVNVVEDDGKVVVAIPFSPEVDEPYTYKQLAKSVVSNFAKDGVELKKGDILEFTEEEGFVYYPGGENE